MKYAVGKFRKDWFRHSKFDGGRGDSEAHRHTGWRQHKPVRVRIRVRVTLRLAGYRQSVRLGDKHLETNDQQFYFLTEHLRS
jgi:hypothetical protein